MGIIEPTPVQFLIYFGIFNTVVLVPLLFFWKKKRYASKFLALLLIVLTGSLLVHTSLETLFERYNTFTLRTLSLSLAVGPLIWLFVLFITETHTQLKGWYVLCFLPLMLDICYALGKAMYIRLNDLPNKAFHYDLANPNIQLEMLIRDGFSLVFTVFFCLLSFAVIARHRRRIDTFFSSKRGIKLTWLYVSLVLFMLTAACWIGYDILDAMIIPQRITLWPEEVFLAMTLAVAVLIGYLSLAQREVRIGLPEKIRRSIEKGVYPASSLTQEDVRQLSDSLRETLEKRKVYTNPRLRLVDLSRVSGFPPYMVSKIVSEGLRTTFYALINGCRLREFQRLLADPSQKDRKIRDLAKAAGFDRKGSCYKAFEKYTSLSPRAYRTKSSQQIEVPA